MGVTVRQKVRGKGNPWWIFIAHNGKRKSIKVGDKAAAETLASKVRERLKAGDLQLTSPQKIPAFGEYAHQWLESYARTNLKHTTQESYRGLLAHHLGALMERPLDQITRSEIKRLLYERLGTGLSPSSVARIKALISVILTNAQDDGHIQMNPVARLGRSIKLKSKDRKADVNPLTKEEARDFLEKVGQHYPQHRPFFLMALRTGMRLGEMLALKWGDIDFKGGFLEVRRAFVRGQIVTPKSGKIRRIDMSKQLMDTLKNLQVERKKETLNKGCKHIPDWVFVNEVGQMVDGDNLRRRVFYPALAKAGLRRVRIHDLRHTFASLLLQQGESPAYVKDQMGHHSIQVTVDTYGHLIPGANRQAVDRLDDHGESASYEQKPGCR
jgi:integrase